LKRFNRVTIGCSRKLANLQHAVKLHMAYSNSCWRPGEMKVTPAQAAGVAEHCWTFDELLSGQAGMIECPAGKLAGFFMRFTIRDLLWLTLVVAAFCTGTQLDRYFEHHRRHPGFHLTKRQTVSRPREGSWCFWP
jgi:hypothetical protein